MRTVLLLAPLLAAGCLTGDPDNGKSTFQYQCAGCHGADGSGGLQIGGVADTGGGVSEAGVSANLKERLPELTDDRVLDVLWHGKGAMPGQFSEDDSAALDVLAYLRTDF